MNTHFESRGMAHDRRRTLSCVVVLASLLFLGASTASVASAQDHETQDRDVREEARHVDWHHPRLRLGVSGVGGGFFGAVHGAAGGLAVRVGVQLNDLVAVYLQGHGLLGEYLPDPRPTSLIGFAFHEAMVEVTLLDMVQLGAGPSLDAVWGCDSSNGGGYCGASGAFFGGDFRVAFVAFHRRPEHRHGVVFSVDAHPTWIGHDLVTTMLFGVGGELY
jgi:hypothetical protein